MSGSLASNMAPSAVIPNPPQRKVYKLIIPRQPHCITANFLRTRVSDFFGTNEDTPGECISDNCTDSRPASRSTLLNFVDSLVLQFNAADFDKLAMTLLTACTVDVISHTDLDPARLMDKKVAADVAVVVGDVCRHPAQLRGVAPVLLIWTLLLESHPDGVMQILDKRICYRTVLCGTSGLMSRRGLATEAAQGMHCPPDSYSTVPMEDDSSRDETSKSGSNDGSRECGKRGGKPVSIVEVVIKFTGTCITTRTLHDVFHDLACGPVPTVPCALGAAHFLRAESEESHEMDTFGWYVSARLAKDCCRSACSRAPGSDTVVHRQKMVVDDCARHFIAPTVGCDGAASKDMEEVKRLRKGKRKYLSHLHERSRKYLVELRLVFDEHDSIKDWSTTVLAAESYRSVESKG
jgi:hypothetical protein